METEVRYEEFGEEILRLMSPAPETGSSFTALLELPANQAAKLLHSPEKEEAPATVGWTNHPPPRGSPGLPADIGLLERASRLSVFAAVSEKVKTEPSDFDSNPNCSSDPMVEQKTTKRKEREKAKDSKKKCKAGATDDSEKLPYVHVRARRGQATDSHSLAERARREKINARMKLLQELVPGCNKIQGTAMVLDEIINHVQNLQRQVEFLSMRLASVNPRIDFDIDSLLATQMQAGSSIDSNFQSMVMPLMWQDGQLNMTREQYPQLCHFDGLNMPVWGREEKPNFITPENSLMSYVSSTNSASLHSNHLKKET